MFEKASRIKLRFATPRGWLAVEDLWDLPLTGTFSLDAIAIDLNAQLQAGSISFVNPAAGPNSTLELSFDIVKHVIAVRQREAAERAGERDRAARKQKILGILARQEDAQLEAMSAEELRKLVAEM